MDIVICLIVFIVGCYIFYLLCEGVYSLIFKLPNWIIGSVFFAFVLNYVFDVLKNLRGKK